MKLTIDKQMRLTNNKLSKKIIDKLMKKNINIPLEASPEIFEQTEVPNVTSIEFDLLMYLALIQDQFGNVKGLYYKDVCKDINCCKQSFYNSLDGLHKKGYILINYSYKEKSYWDLTIIDNVFMNERDDKKSYLNINRKLFFTKEFRLLKVNEKKLIAHIALIYNEKSNTNFYPVRICEWLEINSITLAWDYLKNILPICPFIVVPGKLGDMIRFESNNLILIELNTNSERVNYLTHRLKYLCKKSKISFTNNDITDLIILLGQKASAGIGKISSVILYVIESYGTIESRLINKLLIADSVTGEYPVLYR
ncbi:hypothetical protein [Clostridium estertheticum]|uniref:hypothetical protein n=1 Tax=Clostridium estertheticum TaxID=238834 RepID=UPI001C0C3C65|nr:hypothetical protein [Clostridium estertheticum]MBU3173398.1 hypothetical protein [Clostridium estertheticum]